MLQQTRVEMVEKKYGIFLKRFPRFESLARAPLGELLSLWKGLGYNRRALRLKEASRIVLSKFGGTLPADINTLLTLPGVGRATASAILAFAFNEPVVFIETNIRRVYLHVFFPGKENVHDVEILPLVEMTLDRKNPRDWYYALMDLGSAMKKGLPNPNKRSAHYTRQAPFEGSNRQVRGKILEILLNESEASISQIEKDSGAGSSMLEECIAGLMKEGFIEIKDEKYRLKRG